MSEVDVLRGLTSGIVSAYVAGNPILPQDLPKLVTNVYRSLQDVAAKVEEAKEGPVPAVPVKKSVFPDYLICLEDGRKLKMLKRHLHSTYQLTPDAYRVKWGLPPDYPMVAPEYAKVRSRLAKAAGLGHAGGGGSRPPKDAVSEGAGDKAEEKAPPAKSPRAQRHGVTV